MKLPALEELLTSRAAARTLSLRAQGPARALLLGSHRSAHHGRGLEIEEVRPYVAGDDPRSIDWRVTAAEAVFIRNSFARSENGRYGCSSISARRCFSAASCN